MIFDRLRVPIVQAPLAGGPSTPELAAAVSREGGLGFVAAGYRTADQLADDLAATRSTAGGKPLGVNLFVPGPASDPAAYRAYVERLRPEAERHGVELGEPRADDDGWDAKLELLERERVEVVSFTFGCPSPEAIERLAARGTAVWVTVTNTGEARAAAEAGADALVVQGAEAGGHRGGFVDAEGVTATGLLALLQLVRAAVDLPLVATGGIMTGAGVAAALAAGARAAQLGTAFMLCPEAATSEVHRRAIVEARPTRLTRAFTGRLARGVENRFIAEHGLEGPVAYPEIHHVTSPLRAAARKAGDPDPVNLWAGEAHELARPIPAGELVERLAAEAREALAQAAAAARSS